MVVHVERRAGFASMVEVVVGLSLILRQPRVGSLGAKRIGGCSLLA
jgi:hypothetical protein